jgi:type I restriction enzyme S subunit
LLNIACAVNQNFAALNVYSDIDEHFVFHYLEGQYENLRQSSNSGQQQNLNLGLLRIFPIFKPRLEEQRAIATLLSTWDEAIEKTQAIITQLQQRHRGLMQQLLTGKTRLPGFEGEWVKRDLSELLIPIKRKEAWDDNKLYDLISVRRRSGGVFYRESLHGHQILTKTLQKVETGDFLISKMQIVHGASGLVPDSFNRYYVSNSYLILKGNDDAADMRFFNYYSQLPQFYHLCYTSSYGVHIEKMTFDFEDFLSRSIVIPAELGEQQAIATVLSASEAEITLHQTRLSEIKKQKKGLMQKLLTGERRLPIH